MRDINEAPEVNAWLKGELVPPTTIEIPKSGMEIPKKEARLLKAEKARKNRRDNKGIRLKKAEKLGQDFARLSDLDHTSQARSVARQRDRVRPEIRT